MCTCSCHSPAWFSVVSLSSKKAFMALCDLSPVGLWSFATVHPLQASSWAEVPEVSRRAVWASEAVHILLTRVSVWPLLSFHHHPFTLRSLPYVYALRESSAEHPDSQCTCLCVLAHLFYMPYAQPLAQCLAQSRAGVHVCCVKGAVHASHLAVTCQGFATFSSLPDCVCSPKSRAQAPHLFQFLRCVQKTCGGDIRWHPKEWQVHVGEDSKEVRQGWDYRLEVGVRRGGQEELCGRPRASTESWDLLPGLPMIIIGLLLISKDRNKPQFRTNISSS